MHRNRPSSAFLALAVLGLMAAASAGCVDAPPETRNPADDAAPSPFSPAEFDEYTGGIEGVVTNDELVPLAGARVVLEGFAETTTTDGGRFAFSRVNPAEQRLIITGSTLRTRALDFKRQIKAKLLDAVWPLIASGKIRPVVDKVFPLEQAAQAHAYMEGSAHKGKIMLSLQ